MMRPTTPPRRCNRKMIARLAFRSEHLAAGTAPLLVCLPSAGNGDLQFDQWPDTIGPWRTCRLLTAEGHGYHPPELVGRVAELVSCLARHLIDEFALFGHESAALLSYEMAVELARRGMPVPNRLFVSGCAAPQDVPEYVNRVVTEPTEDELAERVLAAVVATGGTPLPSMITAGVRALRADAAMLRDYHVVSPVPLRCPVTTIWWSDQGVDPAALAGWSACGSAELVRLKGSRLSYATEPAELVRVIAARPVASTD